MSAPSRLRCAIYTRKSSEEGLDQEFNSLDAQREACAAFIASQVGLGWKLVPDRYDDGGISGGTMERPSLQRLLQDIRDRRIDVVVVYKIDRLTRSLTDFAKIVDVFDGNGISFVSVTQQFNTTTSMGRLTLNVLLSFAQFEREVTAERIREKIAASKRKGIWMGGTVPLGYEVRDRKLLAKEPEASFVKGLFSRYLELRSVPALAAEVTRQAIEREVRSAITPHNAAAHAKPSRYVRRVGSGMLYKLLANPFYIGRLRHRQNVYDGEHEAIIHVEQFTQVQDLLASQAATPRGSSVHPDAQLLMGLLFDDTGDRMSPTHAKTKNRRFHYYISSRIKGTKRTDSTAWRIPAQAIDDPILQLAIRLLNDSVRLSEWIGIHAPSSSVEAALNGAGSMARLLTDGPRADRRKVIERMFRKIVLGRESVTLQVDSAAIVRLLTATPMTAEPASMHQPQDTHDRNSNQQLVDPADDALQLVVLTLSCKLKRRGKEMRLIIEGDTIVRSADPVLVMMIAKAQLYLAAMVEQPELGSSGVATMFGVDRVDVGRVLPLAFLAPRLLDQILTGRQSDAVSPRQLARGELPILWSEQVQALT